MSIIFLLIIISLVLATGFLIAFILAARSGQFDDNYTPSVRMLWDDDEAPEEDEKDKKTTKKKSKEETDDPEKAESIEKINKRATNT